MRLPEKTGFPAKLICGILYHPKVDLEQLLSDLEQRWTPLDVRSQPYAFSQGSIYYHDTMGPVHHRIFVSFEGLIDPGQLPTIKRQTIVLEQSYSKSFPESPRPVNLDPGLIMRGRMVLATTKDFAHRLYLGGGIYGEVTLMFKQKKIESLPWTYPDISAGHYHSTLLQARTIYERELQATHSTHG